MLFKKKIDRLVDVEKNENNFKETLQQEPLEKNDRVAMVIAAMIVFIPALLVVVAVMVGISYFFMVR